MNEKEYLSKNYKNPDIEKHIALKNPVVANALKTKNKREWKSSCGIVFLVIVGLIVLFIILVIILFFNSGIVNPMTAH